MDEEQIRNAVQRFKFDRFDPAQEKWEYYIQRFETELALYNLLSGDATAEARKNLLLSKVGPEAFRILVDHHRPEAVTTKTYQLLKSTLQRHYQAGICILAERVTFASRYRKEGETVSQFIIALRAIAGNCSFGSSLEERLRDQLAIGINNDYWQRELFRIHTTNEATLQQVEASALVLEQAHNQQHKIQALGKDNTGTESGIRRVKGLQETAPHARGSMRNTSGFTPKELEEGRDCLRCGFPKHRTGEKCPAQGAICNSCGASNHFARVCMKSKRATVTHRGQRGLPRQRRVNAVAIDPDDEECTDSVIDGDDSGEREVNTVQIRTLRGQAARLSVLLNGVRVQMLYDPGAARSVISEQIWKRIGSPYLSSADTLVAYTNVVVETLGETTIDVQALGKRKELPVTVVKQHDQPLFGLDWCQEFDIRMPRGVTICKLGPQAGSALPPGTNGNTTSTPLGALLQQCSELFSEKPSTINGHKAVVHMKEGAIPRLFSARPLPFPMRKAVEQEIHRLVEQNVLEHVDSAITPIEWASPIVCVPKGSGGIRLCVDFKATVNPQVYVDPHPLPRFEDIISKLSGSKCFTKLDLSDAYLQMEVDPASRKYLIIATHLGYFQFKKLPFGVSFAPAIFQKAMDQILSGIPKTAAYIDDILVAGTSQEEHLKLLKEVLERLKQANVRIKKSKCKFMQAEVTYLGYRIDQDGIHPTEEHVLAIKQMPAPSNVKELRSFLGAINYYSRFLPNLQSLCTPLHQLTKNAKRWVWSKESDRVFQHLKQLLSSKDTLVHYDEALPLVLMTDASDNGVGAVLLHRLSDGVEKPVAFASRTLMDREKRYSVIDKEALAIIFGVTKFYQYLYGRRFILQTDHKPLERILGAHQEIPKMAANRLQRWAITLSAYDYDLEYIKGKHNLLADPLSRLPLRTTNISTTEQAGYSGALLNIRIGDLPISKKELQRLTRQDPLLSRVILYMERGWPNDRKLIPQEYMTFYEKRDSLSFEENILLWQGRIVIPKPLHDAVLATLHDGHPGIWATRALARFYVWWPNIDEEVEMYVKKCSPCQQNRPREPESLLFAWNTPSEPWSRIHVDYAGPFEGKYWLVVIDAFSKWLEIKPMQVSTAAVTIKALREIFCRFGLPRVIVSDNGPQFIASEFKDFCTSNNITHIRATPYHPKTNGLAERAVRTFKERYSATKMHRDDLDLTLQRFLISYRNTPHKSTGRSPAELLLGRRIRTKLDLLKPDINHYMDKALTQQKVYHDTRAKFSSFSIGDLVWVGRPEGKGYESGCIMRKTGPLSYIVNVNGIERRKHADQLRKRMAESDVESEEAEDTPPKTTAETEPHNLEQLIHPHTSQPVYRRKNLDPVPQPPPSVQDPSVRQQGNFQPNAIHQPQQDQLGADERSEPESVSDQTVKEPGHELPKGQLEGPQHTLEGEVNNQADQSSNNLPPASISEQRPQRIRRPPSRPYDKYLWDPRAK